MADKCIFCEIANGNTTTELLFADNDVVAFADLYPKAPIHILIVPKIHLASLLNSNETHCYLLGKLLVKANEIAKQFGLDGYKIAINNGINGGQEVFHLHIHLLGNVTA